MFRNLSGNPIKLLQRDLIQPAVGKPRRKRSAKARERVRGQSLRDADNGIPRHPGIRHYDGERFIFRNGHQVDVLQLDGVKLRCKHHRGIFRDAGKHPCRLFYNLVHFIQPVGVMILNVEYLRIAQLCTLHDGVDVKPVCFVGRNPSGGGMRLVKIPHVFKVCHLIADRSGGKADVRTLCNRAGANRRGGQDIIIDNRL